MVAKLRRAINPDDPGVANDDRRATERERIDLKKIQIKRLPSKVTIGLRTLRRRRA